MTEKISQGFSNQLTWLMNVHLNESETLNSYCQKLAQEYQNKYEWANQIDKNLLVLCFITNLVGYTPVEVNKSFANDLVKNAVQTINWLEIAEQFLEG